MRAADLLVEFYDPEADALGKAHMDDSRRPRLTMLHIQKLRKARDVEKYEKAQQTEFLPDMYGASDAPAGGI